ncbi:porin [Galbibacter sp. EGI 63066]|uniref:porin n=1 Tax=Galbibacter sp. EGI 63066 TaxID=2993559 RepID=UPI002248E8C4|nr:porin [Galbibacter sp. EGI 63066]MCX2681285.1 porin [Galbibacter sp. EGI 63066]
MKYRAIASMLFVISCCVHLNAQEVKAPSFGKGIIDITGKDSTWTMNLSGRMQFLSSATWQDENDNLTNFNTDFLIRRARIKLKGYVFSKKLEYKVELGLSNRDIGGASVYTNNAPRYILDAVVKWNFYKNFSFWVGQTKLPGNVERVISSGSLQFVDRSLLNSRFTLDRDMGFQLRHHFNLGSGFTVREKFSLAQGEGRNITVGNQGGYKYTGRIELLPFGLFEGSEYKGSDLTREKTPKLMFATTYDFNDDAVKTRSNMGSFMETDTGLYETDVSTLFVDMVFKYQGFSFMGEYAYREADNPIAENSDGSLTGDIVEVGNGLNLQAGYLFKNNWELSTRYTNIDPKTIVSTRDEQNQYTLGLSKYIVGHKLKVQTDVSYLAVNNNTNELMARLQLEVHF